MEPGRIILRDLTKNLQVIVTFGHSSRGTQEIILKENQHIKFFGIDFAKQSAEAATITGAQPMMSWPMILLHVLIVSFLSNIGKLFPLFFYRDRRKRERLALSIGMFTRGEVGAGIIFIALGYNLGGPALMISVLTIVFNLILTGIFVVWVEKLTRSAYQLEMAEKQRQ